MSGSLLKISVIITTYNSEATLQRVINSLRNQSGNNDQFKLEILIIDDCSTDNTANIIKANGLEYFSTSVNSGGPNKGRNIGLQKCSGDFICIVDHDDEWHPDKIVTALPYFEKAPIVTSGHSVHDTKTGKRSVISCRNAGDRPYLYFGPDVTFRNKLLRNGKGQHTYLGGIMYSSRLKQIAFEETYGMVDYDWLLRLFHNQDSIEICKPLYTRYVDGSNLSLNKNYRLNDYNYCIGFVQTYKGQYPGEVEQSVKKISGSLARYFYLTDDMQEARKYFLKSGLNLKTVLYYLTTFMGSGFVKRKFKVFG